MAHFNPLFVDSTRVRGERIAASVELNGIQLRPGESVRLRIIEADGSESLWRLDEGDSNNYFGEAWVSHQGKIFSQFQVLQNEKIIFQSCLQASIGSYGLFATWQPHFGYQKNPLARLAEQQMVMENAATATRPSHSLKEGISQLLALWDL